MYFYEFNWYFLSICYLFLGCTIFVAFSLWFDCKYQRYRVYPSDIILLQVEIFYAIFPSAVQHFMLYLQYGKCSHLLLPARPQDMKRTSWMCWWSQRFEFREFPSIPCLFSSLHHLRSRLKICKNVKMWLNAFVPSIPFHPLSSFWGLFNMRIFYSICIYLISSVLWHASCL